MVRVDVDRCVTIKVGDSSEQRECVTMPLGLKKVATSLLTQFVKDVECRWVILSKGAIFLLEPSKNGSVNMENIKVALMKHATDAMKESRVYDFLASRNVLQYRRMDFEEFCADAINIYQLEALRFRCH
nr:CDPK-related kinase 5-like [Tanacetum cinerariifolium]